MSRRGRWGCRPPLQRRALGRRRYRGRAAHGHRAAAQRRHPAGQRYTPRRGWRSGNRLRLPQGLRRGPRPLRRGQQLRRGSGRLCRHGWRGHCWATDACGAGRAACGRGVRQARAPGTSGRCVPAKECSVCPQFRAERAVGLCPALRRGVVGCELPRRNSGRDCCLWAARFGHAHATGVHGRCWALHRRRLLLVDDLAACSTHGACQGLCGLPQQWLPRWRLRCLCSQLLELAAVLPQTEMLPALHVVKVCQGVELILACCQFVSQSAEVGPELLCRQAVPLARALLLAAKLAQLLDLRGKLPPQCSDL
mmetsp:Transcript_9322/g.26212  ORF Transcript_9322/g.26212 Transcript_9322/m.26212 type:complete len:309 (-) Transcript_9322:1603-2529(-)